ncbi:Protein of unknown function DUF295 [Macleaya cordata]|uniref:KIB1-4 beta-propeller domain-containing protein n=1 Tax=Macleaya cordata TaxID=56857 RepID=A0A200PSX0_MACCD|nr:Protein of unknown function DUF295 [Macleaya cordata]
MEEKLAEAERSSERRHLPPGPRAAPWIMFQHGKGKKDQTFFNLCDEPSNGKKTYRKCIPELSGNSFWQSPSNEGWLIVLCNNPKDDNHQYPNSNSSSKSSSKWKFGDCFLWNPESLETIQLPSMLHNIEDSKYNHIIDAVMSSPPSNPDYNSMVFFLFGGCPDYALVFCRPGVYTGWRIQYVPKELGVVRGVFCFKGKLHISFPRDQHIEIEILGLDHEVEPFSIQSLHANHQPLSAMLGRFTPFRELYVVSCDEVFRVVQIYHPKFLQKEVWTIEIFRMDFSSMTWVNVKSLGDHVLFFGKNTTMSCSATEMGLARGCVYFTLPEDMSLYKFDLEGESISVSLPCPDLPMPWQSSDWVMIPTMIRVADGRRRTKDIVVTNEEEYIIKEVEENKTSINVDEKEAERHKKSEGEIEKTGSWDILSDAILEIASHLHPVDHIHFRAVSRENRSTIPAMNWRTASTNIIQTTSLSPWLVFSEKDDHIYHFIDPMHNNEKYHMNLSEFLFDSKIRFSKGGWLLMSSGKKTMFFFNPFTRERIQLPDFPGHYEYMFFGISFSSLPTESDCVVFAITEWGENAVFIFFISRGDTSWRYRIVNNTRFPSNGKCMEFIPWFNSPVFYNRVFYCLDYDGKLGVFDLEDQFSWKVLAKPEGPCSSVYQSFLVECEGKLLSVFLGHLGSRVLIYRLDFSKMVWVKVKSLGKHLLLISHTSCLSAIAPKSRMENKIYFPRFHGEGILFYSLDTCRYHCLGSGHSRPDFYDTKEHLNCSWIEPNWSRTTVQELDWLSV